MSKIKKLIQNITDIITKVMQSISVYRKIDNNSFIFYDRNILNIFLFRKCKQYIVPKKVIDVWNKANVTIVVLFTPIFRHFSKRLDIYELHFLLHIFIVGIIVLLFIYPIERILLKKFILISYKPIN